MGEWVKEYRAVGSEGRQDLSEWDLPEQRPCGLSRLQTEEQSSDVQLKRTAGGGVRAVGGCVACDEKSRCSSGPRR